MRDIKFRRPRRQLKPAPRLGATVDTAADSSPAIICRMIFDELCVLANGDIVCSCADTAGLRVYGNVYRDEIDDVYNGFGYQEMRRWQLSAPPDSWCPVIQSRCGGRISRSTSVDLEVGCTVKTLQLEPTSHCNLRCPACPVAHFAVNPVYRADRVAFLPAKVMLDVVDQLPDLEKVLFYNFGEPFLHPEAIAFLRAVRRRKPHVQIHSSTNGLPLKPVDIQAIASEALLDRMVFSVDGARPESYARYRVGGKLCQVLRNMEALLRAREKAGNEARLEVPWQYILFEWNDSDEEIAEARRLAQQLGIPIRWVLTQTEGASRRFTPGSLQLHELASQEDPYQALTCELRMADLWEHGGAAQGRYLARLTCPGLHVSAPVGQRVATPIGVENLAPSGWRHQRGQAFRLGQQLRSAGGCYIKELRSVPLPEEVLSPGGRASVILDFSLPSAPGSYQLLVDVVEEGVCWFSERGSQPLVLKLQAISGTPRQWDWERLVAAAFKILLKGRPPEASFAYWVHELGEGQEIEVLYRECIAHGDLADSPVLRSRFWRGIASLVEPAFPGGRVRGPDSRRAQSD